MTTVMARGDRLLVLLAVLAHVRGAGTERDPSKTARHRASQIYSEISAIPLRKFCVKFLEAMTFA
jgi:hypothetical protein